MFSIPKISDQNLSGRKANEKSSWHPAEDSVEQESIKFRQLLMRLREDIVGSSTAGKGIRPAGDRDKNRREGGRTTQLREANVARKVFFGVCCLRGVFLLVEDVHRGS